MRRKRKNTVTREDDKEELKENTKNCQIVITTQIFIFLIVIF